MSLYKKVYKVAKKNKEFMADQKIVDEGYVPGFFISELEKAMYAVAYEGWLVGKYGPFEALKRCQEIEDA